MNVKSILRLHDEFIEAGLPISSVKQNDGVYEPVFTRELTEEEQVLSDQVIADHVEETYDELRAENYAKVVEQLDRVWHDIDNGKLDKTGEFYLGNKAVKESYPKP